MSNPSEVFFLIGAARSGTTLLGEQLLSMHPDLFFLLEPDYIWQLALGYQWDDVLTEKDANSKVRQLVTDRLLSAKASDQQFLLEKSPSNCFRIHFLKSVFPNAKFIHIIRDGRDVALSSSKEWAASESKALDSKELRRSSLLKRVTGTIKRNLDVSNRFKSFGDFYYLPRNVIRFTNYLRRQLLGNDRIPWGPKFPGIKQVRKKFSLLETCAIQWERSVVAAENSLDLLEEEKVYRLKYEDLIQDPTKYLKILCHFMNISNDESLIDEMASKVVSKNTAKWKTGYSEEELEAVMNQISFTLKNLGYETQ